MILIDKEASVLAVRVVVGLALSIVALAYLVEMTLFMRALFMYFLKKVLKTRYGFTLWASAVMVQLKLLTEPKITSLS